MDLSVKHSKTALVVELLMNLCVWTSFEVFVDESGSVYTAQTQAGCDLCHSFLLSTPFFLGEGRLAPEHGGWKGPSEAFER